MESPRQSTVSKGLEENLEPRLDPVLEHGSARAAAGQEAADQEAAGQDIARPAGARQEVDLSTALAELQDMKLRLKALDADSKVAREREARFRILSELVTDCCWVRWRSLDGSEERGWVNEAFSELTGYTPEEFEDVGRDGLVHPEDLEKVAGYVDGPVGISEHEFRIIRKDGEVRWLFERMFVRQEEDGLTFFGATRDVTAEKEAREILVRSRDVLERRVAERTAELVATGQRLEREVEERREIASELRQAKEAAEASSRTKSEFLAVMTHELRTPLHGIVGLADLLLGMDLPQAARDRLLTLENSARSLQHLVQEVLDFSKIEADQVALEEHPFSLRQLADDLCEMIVDRVTARGNRLQSDVDSTVAVRVAGDSNRLRQVLLNLLDNAAKFTRDGVVALKIMDLSDGRIRFSVRDEGIGLDEEAQERVFEPFTQADVSTTRRYGGTGLGLAISRRLVALMGGELAVESAPGEGSEFSFTLKLEPAQDLVAGDAIGIQMIDGAGRWILVAEDNPVNQMVVREQLETLGFQVDIVGDGLAALEALDGEKPYDIWLLDCRMPVMDGFEAARQWRAREQKEGREARRLPVVAVTASALRDELDACLEAGMDDLLTKPYRLQDLAAVLARSLA